MSDGFPLLTTKKMAWKTMVTELLWFLRGDTNIEFLHDNDCHIWDGDYAKSGRKDGDLGPIYGKQWRSWDSYNFVDDEVHTIKIDQITNSIHLLKTDPDSRRNRVNSWNVGELDQMTLPPCHTDFQFYTRPSTREEKITNPGKYRTVSLMFNMRSSDVFLGLPFNLASYGLLLQIIANEVGMIPDELICNLGDTHLYLNHLQQARLQMTREPYELPSLICKDEYWYLKDTDISFSEKIEKFQPDFFKIEGYQSHPAIKAPLSN
jgi:thymidylate synthase